MALPAASGDGEENRETDDRRCPESRSDVQPAALGQGEPLAHRAGAGAWGTSPPGQVALGVQVARLPGPIVAPCRPADTHRGGRGEQRASQPQQRDHALRAPPASEGVWPAAAASISHTTLLARTRAAGKGDRPLLMCRRALALFSPVARKTTSWAASMTG